MIFEKEKPQHWAKIINNLILEMTKAGMGLITQGQVLFLFIKLLEKHAPDLALFLMPWFNLPGAMLAFTATEIVNIVIMIGEEFYRNATTGKNNLFDGKNGKSFYSKLLDIAVTSSGASLCNTKIYASAAGAVGAFLAFEGVMVIPPVLFFAVFAFALKDNLDALKTKNPEAWAKIKEISEEIIKCKKIDMKDIVFLKDYVMYAFGGFNSLLCALGPVGLLLEKSPMAAGVLLWAAIAGTVLNITKIGLDKGTLPALGILAQAVFHSTKQGLFDGIKTTLQNAVEMKPYVYTQGQQAVLFAVKNLQKGRDNVDGASINDSCEGGNKRNMLVKALCPCFGK